MNSLIMESFQHELVSFYGIISTSTAQNGLLIHPQGIQPLIRTNYSIIINKKQAQRKKVSDNSRRKTMNVIIVKDSDFNG